jgi:Mce-associated membrane protein
VSEDKTIKILEDDTAVGADTEVVEDTEKADAVDESDATGEPEAVSDTPKRRIQWSRIVAFVVLPALALVLALGAGFLKWQDDSYRRGEIQASPVGQLSLAEQSVRAAKDITIALLSYTPDKVEQQLGDAKNLLTGEFRESYTSLTNDVVIPGAKEKQISAVASVPAAASVSATPTEAVVLVFVNQTVIVGQDAPTDTASSVRVTLQKVGDRWLISKFDPV